MTGAAPDLNNPASFVEPWQAHAFAIVLTLHERGLFSWGEWADSLGEAISLAQRNGDPDLGNTYYDHWLSALQSLLEAKGLASIEEIGQTEKAWARASDRTPHGQAIMLLDEDFQG